MKVSRNNNRPTIKQVALEAGVCKTTVSHAFSGRRPVSEEVKKRIMRVAKKLGYQPHYAAQILPHGRTKTIAVLVRDLINQYNTVYLQAIEHAAWIRGYRVYVCLTGTDQEKIQNYLANFSNGQADGALVITSAVTDEAVIEVAKRGYPVVTPLRTIRGFEYLWNIPVDIGGVFRRLLEYLYNLGHREFGFIWHFRSHAKHRIKVLSKFAIEKGIDIVSEREITDVHTVEQATSAVSELLQTNPEITALVCANDMQAAGAMVAAHKLRLAVPEDLTVTGFGDVSIGRHCTPAITTVRLPINEVAEVAVNKLLDRIEDKAPVNGIESLPELELLIRGSSGPPRKGGARPAKRQVSKLRAVSTKTG